MARQPNIEIFENHLAIDLDHQPEARSCRAEPLPRRLRARQEHRRSVETFAAPVTLLATGRVRQGLPLHDQPRHRDRRRRGDGLSRRRRGGEHGVHPVPPDLPLSSEGQDRSSSARRCAARAACCKTSTAREFMDALPSAEIAGPARHRGARHRQRDEEDAARIACCSTSRTSRRASSSSAFRTSTRPACSSASTSRRSRFRWCRRRTISAAAW